MLLSTANLLLLGILQPALAQCTAECGGSKLVFKQLTSEQVMLAYNVKNTGCDAGVRTWVGVWSADASLRTDFNAWKYLEGIEGEVSFGKTELGPGEWKAAFLCEDGFRTPFLLSSNFGFAPPGGNKPSDKPAEKPRKCTWKLNKDDAEPTVKLCAKVEMDLCFDCGYGNTCHSCEECRKQCGEVARKSL